MDIHGGVFLRHGRYRLRRVLLGRQCAGGQQGSQHHKRQQSRPKASFHVFVPSFLSVQIFRRLPNRCFPCHRHLRITHFLPTSGIIVARGSYQFKWEPVFFIKLYRTFAYACVLFRFSQKSPYICLPLCSFCLFAQISKKRKKTVDRAEHQC